MTRHLNPSDRDEATQGALHLMRAAFPSYMGRKFKLVVTDAPQDVRSYWDGGSRGYFRFVALATGRVSDSVPAQSAFDQPIAGADRVILPNGVGLVEHCFFVGNDMGLRLIIRPENAAPLLPAAVDLATDERIVLAATRDLKSSYAGIHDYRYHDRGRTMGRDRWDAAKAACTARGLMNKAGAITPAGRNALSTTDA